MVWKFKHDIDADPFNLDQNTIWGVGSIRIKKLLPITYLGKSSVLKEFGSETV